VGGTFPTAAGISEGIAGAAQPGAYWTFGKQNAKGETRESIKQRNVGRVAILFIVVCYLILEPFEMFLHLLDLPVWTGRTAVALIGSGRKLDRAIIAVLAVALFYFAADKFWFSKRVAVVTPTATVVPAVISARDRYHAMELIVR
jgi:hypothetical protein